MIVLQLLSFILSPLLSWGMLCCLSEHCRQLTLGWTGLRPLVPADRQGWAVYGIGPEEYQRWSIGLLSEMDADLSDRIRRRSWYPLTDTARRLEAYRVAVEQCNALARSRQGGSTFHPNAKTASGGTRGPGHETLSEWRRVLGVSVDADWASVKLAYRRLASVHGDHLRRGSADPDQARAADEAMSRINRAFEAARAETGLV